jgi:hypothetical protein
MGAKRTKFVHAPRRAVSKALSNGGESDAGRRPSVARSPVQLAAARESCYQNKRFDQS